MRQFAAISVYIPTLLMLLIATARAETVTFGENEGATISVRAEIIDFDDEDGLIIVGTDPVLSACAERFTKITECAAMRNSDHRTVCLLSLRQ